MTWLHSLWKEGTFPARRREGRSADKNSLFSLPDIAGSRRPERGFRTPALPAGQFLQQRLALAEPRPLPSLHIPGQRTLLRQELLQIGRASCRERVEI